ncbi:MAG: hypothetical protein V2A61_08395 [Calditrichota bacterium]
MKYSPKKIKGEVMAATLQVTAKTGFVKKIESQYVKVTDGFGGAIRNTNAQSVNVNDYLDIEKDCLLLDFGASVSLKFIPDPSGSDGQGCVKIKTRVSLEKKVEQVSGNVFITRARDVTLTDCRNDIYNNLNRENASTGDKLGDGDWLLCEKQNAWFVFSISAISSSFIDVLRPEAMPGLDEGVNDINAF